MPKVGKFRPYCLFSLGIATGHCTGLVANLLFISGVPSAYHCVISLIFKSITLKILYSTTRKRSLAGKVMFLHLCVIHFTEGVSIQGGLHTEGICIQGHSCIWEGWTDPPPDAMGYGQQCIRYASYWNAFFFILRYVHHCNSHNGQNNIITDRYSLISEGSSLSRILLFLS